MLGEDLGGVGDVQTPGTPQGVQRAYLATIGAGLLSCACGQVSLSRCRVSRVVHFDRPLKLGPSEGLFAG